jgi:hypothetical protein
MQNVSTLYKLAMKQPLREPSYMRVMLGVINQDAQEEASVAHDAATSFSRSDIVGAAPSTASYAGFDCAKVNGRQILLPQGSGAVNTGLVSSGLVSESPFALELTFPEPVDVKGLTLTFDENAWPTAFTVTTDNGTTAYENTAGALWTTDDAFIYVSYIRFTFTQMSLETARLRLKALLLGFGLTYSNDDIIDSEWRSYASEISEDMPQVDFSVTLKNYDHYFDSDNPASVVNFLDTDMPIEVHYGMTLEDGSVEWFQAAQCYIADWSADERQAVISGTDVLRTMESEYYKGKYYPNGISLYALAEAVFSDAGIEDYVIDTVLNDVFTKNPLPRVPHKEALQIIANAARCVLTVRRDGVPMIVSYSGAMPVADSVTDFNMTRNDMLSYPVTTNNKAARRIDAIAFFYGDGPGNESLFSDEVTVSAGSEMDVFLTDPSYGYAASIETGEAVSIVESGAYYVRVRFAAAGTFKLVISGHKYNVTTSVYSASIRQNGEVRTWENPLISDMDTAAKLAIWLASYYGSDVLYEYETRGNPELDPNDVIRQESRYLPEMLVRVREQAVRFNGALSGRMVTKRVI